MVKLVHMPTHNSTKRDLRRMSNAILNSLKALKIRLDKTIEEIETEELNKTRIQSGVCNVCKKPIYVGDELLRDVHKNCYMRLNSKFVRPKIFTWQELEALGVIGGKGSVKNDAAMTTKEEELQAWLASLTDTVSQLTPETSPPKSEPPKKKPGRGQAT